MVSSAINDCSTYSVFTEICHNLQVLRFGNRSFKAIGRLSFAEATSTDRDCLMGQAAATAAKQGFDVSMRVTIERGRNWLLFRFKTPISGHVTDQLDKWHQVRQRIVSAAFAGRPATVYVRLPQHEDLSRVLDMPAALATLNNVQYQLYTRDSFDEGRLADVTDSVGFELASMWIGGQGGVGAGGAEQGMKEAATGGEKGELGMGVAEKTKRDPPRAYDSQAGLREVVEAAEMCDTEEGVPETGREVCVCVADGSVVYWLNPPVERRGSVLEAVQNLVREWGWELEGNSGGATSVSQASG